MSKLIRRKKEIGAALAVALQLITVNIDRLDLPFRWAAAVGESSGRLTNERGAPGRTKPKPPPVTDRSALRASAVYANKVYGPRARRYLIWPLAALSQRSQPDRQRNSQCKRATYLTTATLTTDQEDYPPYSYVYFHGTGFQPGETVNMIVVELDPIQQSFEPWDVVADENGEIQHELVHLFPEILLARPCRRPLPANPRSSPPRPRSRMQAVTGTMTVSPTSVSPGSTNNSFTFQFRALNGGGMLTARDRLPLSWFQPVGRRLLRHQVNPALSMLRGLAQGQ